MISSGSDLLCATFFSFGPPTDRFAKRPRKAALRPKRRKRNDTFSLNETGAFLTGGPSRASLLPIRFSVVPKLHVGICFVCSPHRLSRFKKPGVQLVLGQGRSIPAPLTVLPLGCASERGRAADVSVAAARPIRKRYFYIAEIILAPCQFVKNLFAAAAVLRRKSSALPKA